jgi:hypothetical protein
MAKKSEMGVDKGMMVYGVAGPYMVDYAKTEDVKVEKPSQSYMEARGMGDAMGGGKFKVR